MSGGGGGGGSLGPCPPPAPLRPHQNVACKHSGEGAAHMLAWCTRVSLEMRAATPSWSEQPTEPSRGVVTHAARSTAATHARKHTGHGPRVNTRQPRGCGTKARQ